MIPAHQLIRDLETILKEGIRENPANNSSKVEYVP